MLHTPGSTCQNNIIRNCACRDGAKGCLTQWFQNAALTLACVASGGDCAKEHPHDWTHRVRQDRNCKAVGQTSRRSLCQGAILSVQRLLMQSLLSRTLVADAPPVNHQISYSTCTALAHVSTVVLGILQHMCPWGGCRAELSKMEHCT